MKRACFQNRTIIAALLAGLLSSGAPTAAVTVPSQQNAKNRDSSLINLARTAEVKVTAGPAGVLIEWSTSFELDNLGFNVYREQGGIRTQINPSIIAGGPWKPGRELRPPQAISINGLTRTEASTLDIISSTSI